MALKADFHLHSSFSGDSDAPMEEIAKKAISLGRPYTLQNIMILTSYIQPANQVLLN